MKVTISQTSLRRADWLRVFGDVAIEVQPAAPGKYRVDIAALKILRRGRVDRDAHRDRRLRRLGALAGLAFGAEADRPRGE